MRFEPELVPCTLLRRYKRFLADVEFDDGARLTAHCPNTGAMLGCAEPGSRAWLADSDNPKRKYRYTLEVVRSPLGDVGINSARANRLVEEALHEQRITELTGYAELAREAPVPDEKGRFDFRLARDDGVCFVEVKSMTLAYAGGRGAFPDAVSDRALRHVNALVRQVEAGHRGVLLFCVQHTGINFATTADDIHPAYGEAVRAAADAGVEVLAYGCDISPREMRLASSLPVRL